MDINNLELFDLETMAAEMDTAAAEETAPTVGTLTEDDRRDPEHEPARRTAESWKEGGFYAVTLNADPGDAKQKKKVTVKSYEDYIAARDYFHESGYYITGEDFQTEAEYFPGLLTYEDAIDVFKTADERHLELKNFPQFSKTAKIGIHDSVVLAADTGAGKSSLAINFLNDLNDDYPVLYFNLEMDFLTILRRLVAIRTGINLDRLEGYQKDEHTEAAVNSALRAITSRKPLQIINDVYYLEDTKKEGKFFPGIETVIRKTTEDRKDPTIVIIDHSLLVKTADKKVNGRYERFTHISEELRRISKKYNIVLFILLQQNREGKKDEEKEPTNSSLKESGSWENDATQIVFLWDDPKLGKDQKKLIMTKNRNGNGGKFIINYTPKTQTYTEAKDQAPGGSRLNINNLTLEPAGKQNKRDKEREKMQTAYLDAVTKTGGKVYIMDFADALDLKQRQVKNLITEYGGYKIEEDGLIIPDYGFKTLTPGDAAEASSIFDDPNEVLN